MENFYSFIAQRLPRRNTGKMAIAAVMIMAAIAAMSSSVIFTQRVLAQVSGDESVSGGGSGAGTITCPNGSTVDQVGSSFNGAIQNGQFIGGGFLLLAATGLEKTGTFTDLTITRTNSGFVYVLTGIEQTDPICGAAPGASVTLSGPCLPQNPIGVGTVQFTASNGEKSTFSATSGCILPLTALFQNQGECIAFANHNSGNSQVSKEACMQAFKG